MPSRESAPAALGVLSPVGGTSCLHAESFRIHDRRRGDGARLVDGMSPCVATARVGFPPI